MEIKPFSMKVNPEQSGIIQKFLFANGYCWASGSTKVSHTKYNCLILKKYDKEKPQIVWSNVYESDKKCPLITFEQFKELYVMKQTLEITPDKILSAAKKCPQAKEVLKEMFPGVFEEDKYFIVNEDNTSTYLCPRRSGEFTKKAFYLSTAYNWKIKIDDEGVECLVPTKKS